MTDIHVFFKKSENNSDVYKLLEQAFESVFCEPVPTVLKDENGKPYFPEKPHIHFSLSHSGQFVMCALSDMPIGADIQKAQPISDKMTKRVFTEKELVGADAVSLWCLKESFIKLKGKTDRDYREMEFIKADGVFSGPDGTWGTLINKIDGYVASVCAENDGNVKVLML